MSILERVTPTAFMAVAYLLWPLRGMWAGGMAASGEQMDASEDAVFLDPPVIHSRLCPMVAQRAERAG